MFSFFSLKKLLLQPSTFFASVENEKGWKKPLGWLILSFGVFVFLNAVHFVLVQQGFTLFAEWSSFVDVDSVNSILVAFFLYAVLTAIVVISIPVTHFITTQIGGKGNYEDTVKAVCYPYSLMYFFGWIPVVGVLITLWSSYVMYVAFVKLHHFSGKRALAFLVIYSIISVVIIVILLALLVLLAVFFISLFSRGGA